MNGPAVVSDTSPVRALAHLDHMDLLAGLFGRVLIPPAVAAELEQPKSSYPPLDLRRWPFVSVRSVRDAGKVREFLATLDPGESEAIALALEVGATYLLMDEMLGREAAVAAGLVPLGALGILLRAKAVGLIPAVQPLIQ